LEKPAIDIQAALTVIGRRKGQELPDLAKANIPGANLSGANLSGADLDSAHLNSAYLSGANLSGANLLGANLTGANLTGAKLSRVDLTGANLTGANLGLADLNGAYLSGADLSSANVSGANLRAPNNTQRPDVNGTPTVLGAIGPGQLWFDTSLFSSPPENTFGNAVRNGVLDGPSYVNLDATIAKLLSFPHGLKGEIRADVFNVTNTPHFDRPNGTYLGATFGQITSTIAGSERSLRFGVRLMF